MKRTAWERDEGYSGCKVARYGEIAIVICPPDFCDDGWGYQAFDESDDETIELGEIMSQRYGFASEADVMAFIEVEMA